MLSTSKGMNKFQYFYTVLLLLAAYLPASAQEDLGAFRKAYDFPAAVDFLERKLETTDSASRAAIEEELILCHNGLGMMNFCTKPTVISRIRFSIDDFFLYYPLPDRSWRKTPNQLDSLSGHPLVRATYIPDRARELYYSSADENGVRNIYKTVLKDTLWSAPQLLNETLTSPEDDIYPMVSADGKYLYFSSKGLFGMGGYDLFVSKWDESLGDWGTPANMGFPFSSPYDDFLFVNTRDGKYSLFASNRECPADSVYVYVLEQELDPIHKKVEDVGELRALSSLQPRDDASDTRRSSGQSASGNESVKVYMAKLQLVKDLRDSLSAFNAQIEQMRIRLSSDTESDPAALKSGILAAEMALPAKKAALDAAVKDLQKVEMEFLSSGIVIDPERLKRQSDREMVGTASGYTFSKREMGMSPDMKVEQPVPEFDYSFKVMDEGQFAQDNTLPEGLVYQIQLFSLSKKAETKDIKGLSPVFERTSGGRFIYSAGLFRTYKDVLQNLNTVKRRGFKNAIIVAFKDGKIINVSNARALESRIKTLYKVRIYPADGQTLPEIAKSAINQMEGNCDIVRTMDGGAVVFEVSPIDGQERAEALEAALKAAGVTNCSVEEAGQSEQTK